MKKTLALLLAAVMVLSLFAGCQENPNPGTTGGNNPTGTNPTDPNGVVTPYAPKQAEYNTTTQTMPSNWNEFTYADNNDTQIMSYITSSFYGYDYKFENDQKFNPDGSINKDGIVPGAYTVNFSAATKLEDVTGSVDAKWGYTAEQKAEGGYAWKITLRDDLKWDDGTAITAEDFEYSMKELLNPLFMNFRANTYYDTLRMKNAKIYFFQNQEGTYETVASQDFASNQAAIDAGKVLYVNLWDFFGAKGAPKITSFDETTFVPVLDFGSTCPNWVAYDDNTYYFDYAYFKSLYDNIELEDGTVIDYVKDDGSIDFDAVLAFNETAADEDKIDLSSFFFSSAMVYGAYAPYFEVGQSYAAYVGVFVENTIRSVDWEDVGCYAIPEENAVVICLDVAYSFLNDEGGLSVWSAYYLSGLPLVKEDLYESCKIEPAVGATLWTSNYNSSLETTASWGPYKLVEFKAGSHYRLEKNPNWYGWNMEDNKNQYNITAINCRKVEEFNTRWMGFLAGKYDDASLQTENVEDYLDSKYVYFTSTSTGTFGMQLFSDLDTLKNSENNNGILAIQEFRHALNLGLNRSDVVEKIWPGSAVPCFGLMNVAYYYDIENAPNLEDGGQYRNNPIAKAGILRAYGYTQAADGTWGTGDLSGLSLEEAYETLTGYNPTVAKEKMNAAIKELTENAEKYGYDPTKDITLVYGSSVDNKKQRDRADYVQGVINGLIAGTALEGKVKVVFDASAGDQWAEAFRSGKTQIGFGYGFSGNAFNPFDIVGSFVNPDDDLNYHMYWDTSAIDMTLTLPAGDYAGAGETITMSVQNWYYCLNGLAESEKQDKTYNWNAGFAPAEARLTILAALEELTIKESRSIMLIADGGGSFLGAKFKYISEEEHSFMGFGGLRYIEVQYTDAEWDQFVADHNNDLSSEYMKSE